MTGEGITTNRARTIREREEGKDRGRGKCKRKRALAYLSAYWTVFGFINILNKLFVLPIKIYM